MMIGLQDTVSLLKQTPGKIGCWGAAVNKSSTTTNGKFSKRQYPVEPLDLIKLTPLMERTTGVPEVTVGLIDGPVAINHPGLATANIREAPGNVPGMCAKATSAACMHATFVAGLLFGRRGVVPQGICPDCTLLVRPVFAETTSAVDLMPCATHRELARGILDCVQAGARVINLSVSLREPSSYKETDLEEALNHAARRGVITVAAAGNQGLLGSAIITRHSWVIPVVACDPEGIPLAQSNLGGSIGRRGLRAPGYQITSLRSNGGLATFSGTSAATAFVTGALALLWSSLPVATATQVRFAVTDAARPERRSVVPPLLNAKAAYQLLKVPRSPESPPLL
jgi:subtilisin family serine protease